MASSPGNRSARNIALVVALVWTVASLGGAWLLLRQSYQRTVYTGLAERADLLARQLVMKIPPAFLAASATQRSDIKQLDLSEPFETSAKHNPRALYAMIWSPTGRVLGHTSAAQIDKPLPVDYQPLDPRETRRFTFRESDPTDKFHDLLEVTVPAAVPGQQAIGFVTVGYSQKWIEDEFWTTQRSLLYVSAGVSVAGLIVIFMALHYTQRAIDRARQELETNARARTSLLTERGMLASVLAHEVRSPLTALRFNLHALRNYVLTEAATEKQLELADRCEREIRRLDLMLNDFLTRTQIIAPIMPTSINQVVKEALDFLRPALDQKNIRVVTHLDPADPRVAVNPDELRQVLLNLSANAQDAMPNGGTITVSTLFDKYAPPTPVGEVVTLLFRDSGVGIPAELHTRIFEPFFTTKASGSGLGLALVRRVISGAGGTIFCESAVGEGTTFRIVLPLATDEPNTIMRPSLEEEPDIVIDHTVAEGGR